MERVDGIMAQLGFNKDSEDSVKAAFVKNLIKQAYGVEVQIPKNLLAKESFDEWVLLRLDGKKPMSEQPQQLSFDLEADAQSKAGKCG